MWSEVWLAEPFRNSDKFNPKKLRSNAAAQNKLPNIQDSTTTTSHCGLDNSTFTSGDIVSTALQNSSFQKQPDGTEVYSFDIQNPPFILSSPLLKDTTLTPKAGSRSIGERLEALEKGQSNIIQMLQEVQAEQKRSSDLVLGKIARNLASDNIIQTPLINDDNDDENYGETSSRPKFSWNIVSGQEEMRTLRTERRKVSGQIHRALSQILRTAWQL